MNETVLRRLADSGLIHLIDHRYHCVKKIRYHSVVELCDRLREVYHVPDERPKLVPPYRHRDIDLLPFPLNDTISREQAATMMGCSEYTVNCLVDEGRIYGYKLAPNTRTPWRISRKSVLAHMERTMRGVAGGPRAYVTFAVE